MTAIPINIVSARQVGDCCLHLVFDDGQEQTIDFKPFLSRSLHTELRAWLEPEKFAAFRIEYGELVWGDYDLCFPMLDLYRNDIEHHRVMETAA